MSVCVSGRSGSGGGSDIVISGSSFVCFCFHDVDDMSLRVFISLESPVCGSIATAICG